mmetsp:Transcript_5811/g.12920  ORF Transcript_5811/g.12920 Transcript_5811/m.12920 type:complete len:149 (-) Transcript_5811:1038-1484(-)
MFILKRQDYSNEAKSKSRTTDCQRYVKQPPARFKAFSSDLTSLPSNFIPALTTGFGLGSTRPIKCFISPTTTLCLSLRFSSSVNDSQLSLSSSFSLRVASLTDASDGDINTGVLEVSNVAGDILSAHSTLLKDCLRGRPTAVGDITDD